MKRKRGIERESINFVAFNCCERVQKVHSAWANLCVFFRCFYLSATEAATTRVTTTTTRATTIKRLQQSRVNINKKPAKLLSHETRRQATYACPVGTAQRAGPGSGQRRQQQAERRQTAADKTRRAKDKTSSRRRQSIACASAYSNLRLIILSSLHSQSSADANESGKTNALPRHTWHILATCVRLRSTCACLCPGWLMPVVFPPPSHSLSLSTA